MASLVRDLQRDALNQSISVVELLQKSLVVATKLKQDDFRAWVQLELDGYKDTDVPSYRVVHGSPKVFNPYRGYQPLIFEDAKEAELYSRMHFNMPIGEIEHSMDRGKGKSSGTFNVSYNAKVEGGLMKAIEFNLQPSLHVSTSQFQKILDAGRKIVLEWALKLEENGVVGEGLGFSIEEKQKAQNITYNVKNYIQGTFDKSPIQIETEESTQTQRIRSRVIAERTALLNQIRGLLGEYGIVFGQGPSQVRRGIAALLTGEDPRLSAMARELVLGFQAELRELDERIGHHDARVKATCAGDARSCEGRGTPRYRPAHRHRTGGRRQ